MKYIAQTYYINELVDEIRKEYDKANESFPQFSSNHEGYAVIKEEIEELWDEIKKDKGVRPNRRMQEECIQIAAMCIKFLMR